MAWKDLSLREKAAYIHTGVRNGLTTLEDIGNAYNKFAEGGNIHIKKSHEGRLTELKERTGKTEAELWAEGNPDVRKMITFARNAREWNKGNGGYLT